LRDTWTLLARGPMSDAGGLVNGVSKAPVSRSTVGDFHDGLGRQVGNVYLLGTGYTDQSTRKAGDITGVPNFGQSVKPAAGKGKTGKVGKPTLQYVASDDEAKRRAQAEEKTRLANIKADQMALELIFEDEAKGDKRSVSKKKSVDKKQKRKKDKGRSGEQDDEACGDDLLTQGSDVANSSCQSSEDTTDREHLTFGQATFGLRAASPPTSVDRVSALQQCDTIEEAAELRDEAGALTSCARASKPNNPKPADLASPLAALTPSAADDDAWEPVVSKKDKRASRRTLAELTPATHEAPRSRGVPSSSASDCSASASASDTGSASSTAATSLALSSTPERDSSSTAEVAPAVNGSQSRSGGMPAPSRSATLPSAPPIRRGWETMSKAPASDKAASSAAMSVHLKPPVEASEDTARSASNVTGRAFNAWAGALPAEGAPKPASEPESSSWPSLDNGPRVKEGDSPAAGPEPTVDATVPSTSSTSPASSAWGTAPLVATAPPANASVGATSGKGPDAVDTKAQPVFSWASVAKKGINTEKEAKPVAASKGFTVLSGTVTQLSTGSATSNSVSGSTASLSAVATATAPTAAAVGPALASSPSSPLAATTSSPTSTDDSEPAPAMSALDLSAPDTSSDATCVSCRSRQVSALSNTSGTQTSPPPSPPRASASAQTSGRIPESKTSGSQTSGRIPGGQLSCSESGVLADACALDEKSTQPPTDVAAPPASESTNRAEKESSAELAAVSHPPPQPKPQAWASSDARMAAVTAPPPGAVPLVTATSAHHAATRHSPPRPASAPPQPSVAAAALPAQATHQHAKQSPQTHAQTPQHQLQQVPHQQHHSHQHQQRFAPHLPMPLGPHGMLPPSIAPANAFIYSQPPVELSEAERLQRSILLAAAEAQHAAASAGGGEESLMARHQAGHAFEVWAAASGMDCSSGKKHSQRNGRLMNGNAVVNACGSVNNGNKVMLQPPMARAQHSGQRMNAAYVAAANQSHIIMGRSANGQVGMGAAQNSHAARRNGQCACGTGPMSHAQSFLHAPVHQTASKPVSMSRLHDEIIQFASANLRESTSCRDDINTITASLKAVVNKRWPTATVELYGSRSTGLYLSTSDMDVVLMGVPCTPKDVGEALTRLRDDLVSQPWVTSHTLVLGARIPVLKLQSLGGVPVDITISASPQHTGLQARDLLLSYLADSPQLAPLVVVFKTFLRDIGLNDPYTGGLSSYCLVVLLYNFWRESLQFGFSTTDCGYLLYGFLSMFVFRFESSITHVDDPLAPSHQLEDGTVIIGDNIMHSCYQIGRVCHIFRLAMAALSPENNAWENTDSPLLPKLFAVANGNRVGNMATQTDPLNGRHSLSSQTDFPDSKSSGNKPNDKANSDRRARSLACTDTTSNSVSRVTVTLSAGAADGDRAGGVICTARPSAAVPITAPPVSASVAGADAAAAPVAAAAVAAAVAAATAYEGAAHDAVQTCAGGEPPRHAKPYIASHEAEQATLAHASAPASFNESSMKSDKTAVLGTSTSASWAAAAALPPAEGADIRPPSRPASSAGAPVSPSLRRTTPPPSPSSRSAAPSPKLTPSIPTATCSTSSSTPKVSAGSPFSVAAATRAADAAAAYAGHPQQPQATLSGGSSSGPPSRPLSRAGAPS